MSAALQLHTPPATPVRVGLALIPGDPFWVQVREAVKQRAADLAMELVRLPPLPSSAQGEAHLSLIEDLRANEVRALIGHAPSPATLQGVLEAGLPVICAEETTLTHPLLVSVRGLNRAAAMAADCLAQSLGGSGHLLLAGGIEDHLATTRSRVQGFRAALAHYPNVRCVHLPTQWRYDEVYAHLVEEEEALRALFPNGHIDAIFGLSDPIALAARDACRALGLADAATRVAGINGDPLAIAAIEAGAMHATVETNPQALGCTLADFARHAARGQPLPDHFDYQLELITAANVSQVAARRLVAMADLPSRLVDVNRRQEEERLRQLRASLEMNRSLGAVVEWDALSRTLAEIIRSRYGYDHVQTFRWSAEAQCLLPATLMAQLPNAAQVALAIANDTATNILAAALLRNRVVYVPDMLSSHRFHPDAAWPTTRARVVLPIRYGGSTIGVLDLHSSRPTVRTQAELDALQALADQLGGAMQNALLYDQALAARAEAEESNRMRAALLAHLSHGLRSPLNVILGYVQSALATPNPYGVALPADLLHDLRLIRQSGADLLRLINELLDLAQAESGTLPLYPELINPSLFFADLFRSAEHVMGGAPGVAWQLQVPDALPPLYADPVRLRSVLQTLLSNAARYTATGSIRLGATADNNQLRIWVEDTGVGIAPERLDGLNREPDLLRADPSGHAPIGLGLGIARHLVRLMGGRLQITSNLNAGTLCQFTLPIAPPATPATPATPAAPQASGEPAPTTPYRLTLDRATTLVKRGVEYIESHYDTPFGRDELARALGVSPAYVSRIFQRELGLSPWDYLTRVRIDHARTLLLAPEPLPVAEIALRVGFSDPAYFARTFRRCTGRAPLAYRQHGAAP